MILNSKKARTGQEGTNMKLNINIEGEAKEIAALALELQGRQGKAVNQLVLDAVHNTTAVENGIAGNAT